VFLLGLALLCISSFSPRGQEVTIELIPVFGNNVLALNDTLYTTQQGDQVTVSAFKFYVSNVRLAYADGSVWAEPISYHLADVEEPESLKLTLKNAPQAPLKALHFLVGIDSATQAAGAGSGDLDATKGMYWAWHSGYINLKLEGNSPQSHHPKKRFELHLGGYKPPFTSAHAVMLPIAERKVRLHVDASVLLSSISLADTATVLEPGALAHKLSGKFHTLFTPVHAR
jgi:hypothetical protein